MTSESAPTEAKITLKLPIKVWRAVEAMAESAGVSRTEMLRRCISTEHWRLDVEAEGGQLLVRNADGSTDRVRFPW